ncbi:MAG: ribosomal RNA small subunit methyltransferase A [Egibacteraceae bacterium]
MSARRRRTSRDERRRSHSQNLLVDERVVDRLLARAELTRDEHVVEIGPGRGALTLPLAGAGARVLAVERDPGLADELRASVRRARLESRVRVLTLDARRLRWPGEPYRVIANLSFGATTALLAHMLDDPAQGPRRADVLVQRVVAIKRSSQPPTSLRSAAWAPWWEMTLGDPVPRSAFRPVPGIDAAWLHITRRDSPVLPEWLAPSLRGLLRPGWDPPTDG